MADTADLIVSSPLSGRGAPAHWRSPGLSLAERTDLGLLHLRGRFDPMLAERIGRALGQPLPQDGQTASSAPVRILRVRIDHWCLVVDETHRAQTLRSLRNATLDASALVADTTGGAVWVSVEGAAATELIATGCATDLDQHVVPVGHATWTRLARLRVLLVREGIDRFLLHFDAANATYAWGWLIANATLIDGLATAR